MKTSKEIKELAKNYNFVTIETLNDGSSCKVYTASEKSVHSIAAICLSILGAKRSEEDSKRFRFLAVPKSSDFWSYHKVINTAQKFYSSNLEKVNNALINTIELDPKEFYLSKTYAEFVLIYFIDSKIGKQMLWKGEISYAKMIIGILGGSRCKNLMYKKVTNQDECSRYVNIRLTNKRATMATLTEEVIKEFKIFDNSNFEL